MNKKIRRKSADEVTVEIKDSEPRKKNYWNLRGNKKKQQKENRGDFPVKIKRRDKSRVQPERSQKPYRRRKTVNTRQTASRRE